MELVSTSPLLLPVLLLPLVREQHTKWIADIFKHDPVSGSFIPPANIRQLRDLVRYRWKLANFTARKNCGCCLLPHHGHESDHAAVNGDMCTEQAEKLRIIRSHMGSLELCKANLESLILTTVEKYLHQLDLVMTVPGSRSFALLSAQAVFLVIPKSTTGLQDS